MTTSYTVDFNEPLDATSASNVGLYRVFEGVKKVVKKHKETVYTKALKIKTVVYNPGTDSVTLTLTKPYKGNVEVTIAAGLEAADGAATTTAIVSIVP